MHVYCHIDHSALQHNIRQFRTHLGSDVLVAVAVKSNAYGHGIHISAQAFVTAGADWLCVHSIQEAIDLRIHGFNVPIYVFGPLDLDDIDAVIHHDLHVLVYTHRQIQALIQSAQKQMVTKKISVHLKLETGNHRQGVELVSAYDLAQTIVQSDYLSLAGLCSHYANIEDTSDHNYAQNQRKTFIQMYESITQHPKILPYLSYMPLKHIANSAASILWPQEVMDIARIGISAYGLWPSTETKGVAQYLQKTLSLKPALSWKTKITQIKEIAQGKSIGYGCTFTTTRESKIAVIPVGYYEGYDRGLSNLSYVLIRGQRAPVRGRVCMNMMMVEVTDIQIVCEGDEVVLLGQQGEENISAEQLATWANTINYEIITRIAGHIPRFVI
jgi:alanine racemase